jgi:hypothetical protein
MPVKKKGVKNTTKVSTKKKASSTEYENEMSLSPEISTTYWNVAPSIKPPLYPETVLLSINAHSGIKGEEDMYTFKEHEKMPNSKVFLINATAIGVCNYVPKITIRQKNEALSDKFQVFDKTQDIEEFVKSIIPTIKEIDAKNSVKYILKSKKISPDTKNYLYSFNKGHNFLITKNNGLIVNKVYSISPEENEERKQYPHLSNSIKILNLPSSNNDLFDILNTNSPLRRIKLKEIIEYLNSNGAKNIIIFDFSCNDFTSDQTPRSLRSKRRRMTNELGIKSTYKKRRVLSKNTVRKNTVRKNIDLFEKKYPKRSKTKRSFQKTPKEKRSLNIRNSV